MHPFRITACAGILLLGFNPTAHADLTAQDIINRIDANQVFTSESFSAEMRIEKGSRTLTKAFFGYGLKQGRKSFMEFTNPEDQGVKYLKLENELWIYFPDADDVMKISGHMLRQGMMGSDISYEDMLENDSLDETYTASRLEDIQVDGRPCYQVELIAKKNDAAYEKQRLAVDQAWFLPVQIEMVARGGRLLKKMTQADIQRIGNRWVPMVITIQDMRKRDSKTLIQFKKITFDQPVPDAVFTKGYLKR